MQLHDQHESAIQTLSVISRLFSLFSLLLLLFGIFECMRSLFPFVYGPLATAMLTFIFIYISIPQNHRKPLIKPAFAVLMLSPFPTWYMHYLVDTPYIVICLLLYNISICYLLHVFIKQCQQIAVDSRQPQMVTLMSWTMRVLIYGVYVPNCLSLIAGFQIYSTSGQSLTVALLNNDSIGPYSAAYVYAVSLLLCWIGTLILRRNLKKRKQLLNEQTCLQP